MALLMGRTGRTARVGSIIEAVPGVPASVWPEIVKFCQQWAVIHNVPNALAYEAYELMKAYQSNSRPELMQ